MNKRPAKSKPGPTPLRVKIDGDWESAMGKALKVNKPAEGWPKPAPMPQRAKKTTKKKAK